MTVSAPMPRYRSHKIVWALKVTADSGDLKCNYVTLTPEDAQFASFEVSNQWAFEKKVEGVGYYVVYENGYSSWSPVEAFEKGYTRIDPRDSQDPARPETPSPTSHDSALTHRLFEISTALGNINKTLQACTALADSVMASSSPMGFRKRWPNQKDADLKPGPITEVDPSTIDPAEIARKIGDNERYTRPAKLSAESPWVTTMRSLLAVAQNDVNKKDIDRIIEEAEALLRDGVSLKS